ncbi:MAG TPA: hypothetical protein VE781_02530 [Kineosporiaceae bacterium]|nr:hypothetical protein [Kineosporiaceae bacterium]
MRPSSFVFVAIVALWAAHLLPQWIRRRDSLGASRGEDRYSDALRVLERRRRRTVRGRSSAPLLPSIPVVTGPAPGPSSALPAAAPALPAVARRRRSVLAVLGAVTVLSVGGALAGVVPAGFAVVCVALLVLDVAALRRVAVAGQRRRAAEVAAARRRAARPARPVPIPVPAPLPVPAQPAPEQAPDADEHVAPVVEEPAAVADGTWVPVPVPPPTYTLKPAAPPREVAKLEPALDPASAPAATVAPAAAAVPAPHGEVDLDSVLERRRAVNG